MTKQAWAPGWGSGQGRSNKGWEERTLPLYTLSSLGHPAVAQSQLVRDLGVTRESGKITAEGVMNYKVTREEKGGEKPEEYHHQKGRKAGEKRKTNAHRSRRKSAVPEK